MTTVRLHGTTLTILRQSASKGRPPCAVAGCTTPSHGKGYCQRHYVSFVRWGDATTVDARKAVTVDARFWSKVDASGDCWEWRGTRHRFGYGRFHPAKGQIAFAHRYAWELLVGPIPTGFQLDHLCRNRGCVNPDHLQPVTSRENTARGFSPVSRSINATQCINGHPFTERTTNRADGTSRTKRICRICAREHDRRYRAKRAA